MVARSTAFPADREVAMSRAANAIAVSWPRNLERGRAIAEGLREIGFEVVEAGATRPAAEPAGRDSACRVAVLVAGRDRERVIRQAESLGARMSPPIVVLVMDDLSLGEYNAVVSHGPVRYVFGDRDSLEKILGGVLLASGV